MKHTYAAIAAGLLLFTGGCKQTQYADVTKQFSDTMDTATAAMAGFYDELNEGDARIYLQQHLFNPALPLTTSGYCVGEDGRIGVADTVLKTPRFAAKDIQARLDVLSTLKNYGELLAQLASSSAPQDLDKSVGDLQASVAKIGQDLPGSGVGNIFSQPVATFAGTVGRIALARRNAHELDRLIVQAQPTVDAILSALQGDSAMLSGVMQTNASAEYAGWITYYNRIREATMLKAPAFKAEVDLPNCPGVVSAYVWVPPPRRASPPPQKYFVTIDRYRDASTFSLRRAILDQVEASREADEAAKGIDVGATIARMKAAHDALVAYARSRDNAITYENLLTAYAAFKDDAQKLSDALHAMSSAQKGS